jgi:hypothetical protein
MCNWHPWFPYNEKNHQASNQDGHNPKIRYILIHALPYKIGAAVPLDGSCYTLEVVAI